MNRRALFLASAAAAWAGLSGCNQFQKEDPSKSADKGAKDRGEGVIGADQEISLAYAIELEGESGKLRTVADTFEFRSRDRFRILVRPQFAAHLYLYARGPGQGSFQLLFPDFKENAANPLPVKQQTVVPGKDAWLTMDSRKGLESVVLIAASGEIPQFNTTEKSIGRDAFEERLAQVERGYRPVSARRFVDREWVKLFAAKSGKPVAWIERLPLLHE
jgi:hypothetical protein